jgi:hypothetical protein
MTVDSVVDVLGTLRPLVEELDVDSLDGKAAAQLVDAFVQVENLAAAGRVLATRAYDRSELWRFQGYRSAASWMAARAGTQVGVAIATMEMAKLLDDLPATEAAFRAGRLSTIQMREVADAASEHPEAEERLLELAGKVTLFRLRQECDRVKAAGEDAKERYRRIHRGRFCRSGTDRQGALRLHARLTPDEGARLVAAIDARYDEMVADARAGGWFEGRDAHRADALVDLARAAAGERPAGPETMVHVWVNYEALLRGHVLDGELCEIPGIGPVPVEVARRMADDSILRIILEKGVDVTVIAHAGRTIPAHLRSALEARDPECIVPGCHVRRGLEIDHRAPFSGTCDTSLANLARLCRWHHFQKSHLGYTYRGGPGAWEWIAPEVATDPPNGPP